MVKQNPMINIGLKMSQYLCCQSLYHLLPLVVIHCTIRCHSLSLVIPLVVTCCHSLPLVIPLVCLFINDALKLWTLPINSIEMILRSSHWRRSAKMFENVFFKIANLQNIQLHLCSKSTKNTCEGVQL